MQFEFAEIQGKVEGISEELWCEEQKRKKLPSDWEREWQEKEKKWAAKEEEWKETIKEMKKVAEDMGHSNAMQALQANVALRGRSQLMGNLASS